VGIVLILAVALAAGYFFWLRDSSLVAVTNVDVVGVSSGDPAQIRADLTHVAEGQTTLHSDAAAIEKAASAYPTIESVSVDPNFPHGMRIEVTERPPAMLVEAGGQKVPAAADGTLLTGVQVPDKEPLPVLEVGKIPASGTLEEGTLQQALILGATPEPLRPLVEKVGRDDDYGVIVTLRGGIPVRFGSGSRAAEKWAAAAAVLADPKLDSLTYLDVRVPERPAAGGATTG
jgi:cell division protein FtsQ